MHHHHHIQILNRAYSDSIDELTHYLKSLGATQVITYDELTSDKSLRDRVKEWTGGKVHSGKSVSQAVSLIHTATGDSSHAQLRQWSDHDSSRTFPGPRRASCVIWSHVKTTAVTTNIFIHLQEPHLSRLLAIQVVYAEEYARKGRPDEDTGRYEGTLKYYARYYHPALVEGSTLVEGTRTRDSNNSGKRRRYIRDREDQGCCGEVGQRTVWKEDTTEARATDRLTPLCTRNKLP